ncbi:hypothetical protein COD64_29045, partial [Bacillus cereus]
KICWFCHQTAHPHLLIPSVYTRLEFFAPEPNKMRNHKVVAYERKGTEIFYRVDDAHVKQTVHILMG